jgi:tetratricopeptide (TPR) repeat protein
MIKNCFCTFATGVLLSIATSAIASAPPAIGVDLPDIVEHQELPGMTPQIQPVYDDLMRHSGDKQNELALEAAKRLVQLFQEQYGEQHSNLTLPSIYLGMAHLGTDSPRRAQDTFEHVVEIIETNKGVYETTLIPPLQGLALSFLAQDDYIEAVDALRRANHITRRHGGVYNQAQLSIVDKLIDVENTMGEADDINALQLLYLRINEDIYGVDTPELIPALLRLAEHKVTLGTRIPAENWEVAVYRPNIHHSWDQTKRAALFKDAQTYYERVIEIVENHYGADDIRLSEPLRGIADAKIVARSGKDVAAKSLRRNIDIVKANPGADTREVALALVELADLFLLWNDSRSGETYQEAWRSIPDDPRYDVLREELFGQPKKLTPANFLLRIRKRPWRYDGETFSSIKYMVRADGRARRLDQIDGNAPPYAMRYLRAKIYDARFRPRMVDGETVNTEGQVWHQEFQLY